jgi:GWxTD domain-containing protein
VKRRIVFAVLLAAVMSHSPCAAAPRDRSAEARRLYERSQDQLMLGTFDSRRAAIDGLEQATLLDPGNADDQLALARAYFLAGFLKSARQRFERVSRMRPEDPSMRFGLGLVWRRDWLKYGESTSLARAIDNLSWAARLDTTMVDAWLMLVPLLIESGQLTAAVSAAQHAAWVRPDLPDAQLAMAATSFRSGDVPRAQSLFVATLPRLSGQARSRFEDISPVASERDTMELHSLGLVEQMEFLRRFWKEQDPDPTTPENELQLEYWTRVTQAYFLYFDPRLQEWDERGEVYVRYGPPEHVTYNPIGSGSALIYGERSTYDAGFPANTLVWDYPSLGMAVLLQDRLLSERYMLPISMFDDPDPRPDPAAVALRGDAVGTHEFRGVFHMLPPGTRPLRVGGSIARFEGERNDRLLAAAEAPGGPADSLWATFVVMDSTAIEVARSTRTLSPLACDPTSSRVADFTDDLAPGRYHVAISIRSRGGARGIYRSEAVMTPKSDALALSDVVVTCGSPDLQTAPVRLAANPAAVIGATDALTAYFEIYHLAPGEEGRSRFEYVYTVRSAEVDPRIWLERVFSPRRGVPPLTATREEQNVGALRRQYLRVPTQDLPAGHYWLDVEVRDLVAGTEAKQQVGFYKLRETPIEPSGIAAPAAGTR